MQAVIATALAWGAIGLTGQAPASESSRQKTVVVPIYKAQERLLTFRSGLKWRYASFMPSLQAVVSSQAIYTVGGTTHGSDLLELKREYLNEHGEKDKRLPSLDARTVFKQDSSGNVTIIALSSPVADPSRGVYEDGLIFLTNPGKSFRGSFGAHWSPQGIGVNPIATECVYRGIDVIMLPVGIVEAYRFEVKTPMIWTHVWYSPQFGLPVKVETVDGFGFDGRKFAYSSELLVETNAVSTL